MKKYIAFLLIVFFIQGCTYRYGNIALMSKDRVDFGKKYTRGDKIVTGTDKTRIYVIIPDKFHPMIDDALENALDKSCARFLTDIKITFNWWYIPYVYGETKFIIEGYPWYLEGENENSCKFKTKIQ